MGYVCAFDRPALRNQGLTRSRSPVFLSLDLDVALLSFSPLKLKCTPRKPFPDSPRRTRSHKASDPPDVGHLSEARGLSPPPQPQAPRSSLCCPSPSKTQPVSLHRLFPGLQTLHPAASLEHAAPPSGVRPERACPHLCTPAAPPLRHDPARTLQPFLRPQ